MSSLERLGWGPFFEAQVTTDRPRFRIARITEEQRGQYRIAGEFDGAAEVSGRFRYDAKSHRRFSRGWRLGLHFCGIRRRPCHHSSPS